VLDYVLHDSLQQHLVLERLKKSVHSKADKKKLKDTNVHAVVRGMFFFKFLTYYI